MLVPSTPSRILPPLIEPNETQCQWSGCDLLFSTPTQLTEVRKRCSPSIAISHSLVHLSISDRYISIELTLAPGSANGNPAHAIGVSSNPCTPSFFTCEHTRKIDRSIALTSVAQSASHELNIYDSTHDPTPVGPSSSEPLSSSNNKSRRKTVSLRIRRLLQSVQQPVRPNEAHKTHASEQGVLCRQPCSDTATLLSAFRRNTSVRSPAAPSRTRIPVRYANM